ncbi:hypothetical protein ACFY3N_14695 [Streptomyces sp. NPDC000348]|uniref:hypothetical protein n=1 Tax=Streptomyces sp. NPDC000348 TaxID=3364538 RepID=UPI0036A646EE
MAETSERSPAVYRLLPSLADYRQLDPNHWDLRQLKRWQRLGAEEDRPVRLRADWMGERRWPKGDFASGYPGAPMLSRHLIDRFGTDALRTAGSLVPVEIDDSKEDEYYLLLVEQVVDCLDLRRSSKPKKMNGEVKKAVYRTDALPAHLPAFRLPQFPGAVQWNGWAVERLVGLTGDEIEARLLWSGDPAAVPHPDPWGI